MPPSTTDAGEVQLEFLPAHSGGGGSHEHGRFDIVASPIGDALVLDIADGRGAVASGVSDGEPQVPTFDGN